MNLNLKTLFVVFLCVLSASAIFTTAAVTPSTVEGCDLEVFTSAVNSNYLTASGAEPTGDPTGGWPQSSNQ
jgi:hypothetical protein